MAFADRTVVTPQYINTQDVSLESLPRPKFPQFQTDKKRTESFASWPEYLPLTPDVLVDAGLVYTGVGDIVRCFYCAGGLGNWERGDNPWEEHAKWYPKCPYVLQCKGHDYVERVKRGENPDLDVQKNEVQYQACDPIDTAAAQACVQMGYSEDLVKKAICAYVKKSGGNMDFKGTDLCQILFDMEEHPERYPSESHSNSVPYIYVTDNQSVFNDFEIQERQAVLNEENSLLRRAMLCNMCKQVDISVFVPCGHLGLCSACGCGCKFIKCSICNRSAGMCAVCHNFDWYPIVSLRAGITCKQCTVL